VTTLNELGQKRARATQLRTTSSLMRALVYLAPVVVAMGMAAAQQVSLVTTNTSLRVGTVAALVVAGIAYLALRCTVRRATSAAAAVTELTIARTQLLDRIRDELPMKTALPLLLQFDPDGDHHLLVEAPPAMKRDLAEAQAAYADLAAVMNESLAYLVAAMPHGAAGAAAALAPVAGRLQRHGGAIPAVRLLASAAASAAAAAAATPRIAATPAPRAVAATPAQRGGGGGGGGGYRTPAPGTSRPAASTSRRAAASARAAPGTAARPVPDGTISGWLLAALEEDEATAPDVPADDAPLTPAPAQPAPAAPAAGLPAPSPPPAGGSTPPPGEAGCGSATTSAPLPPAPELPATVAA